MLKWFCIVLIPCKLKKFFLWVLINFGIAMVGSPLICVLLIYLWEMINPWIMFRKLLWINFLFNSGLSFCCTLLDFLYFGIVIALVGMILVPLLLLVSFGFRFETLTNYLPREKLSNPQHITKIYVQFYCFRWLTGLVHFIDQETSCGIVKWWCKLEFLCLIIYTENSNTKSLPFLLTNRYWTRLR